MYTQRQGGQKGQSLGLTDVHTEAGRPRKGRALVRQLYRGGEAKKGHCPGLTAVQTEVGGVQKGWSAGLTAVQTGREAQMMAVSSEVEQFRKDSAQV